MDEKNSALRYGGILIGLTAIAAAYIANNYAVSIKNWLVTWLAEAILISIIVLFAGRQTLKITKVSLMSAPVLKFVAGFLPPLICGVVITLGLWRFRHYEVMVPVWTLLYGAAITAIGTFSLPVFRLMGGCFITVGALAFLLPAGLGNSMMGLSFGVLHIIFGFFIARSFSNKWVEAI